MRTKGCKHWAGCSWYVKCGATCLYWKPEQRGCQLNKEPKEAQRIDGTIQRSEYIKPHGICADDGAWK